MFVSLEHAVMTLNGHTCQGWADDAEGIMIPDITLTNITKGADGLMAVSSTGERGGEIELKFQPLSPSVQFFGQLLARYQRGLPVIFEGTLVNQPMGINTQFQRGVFTSAPLGQSFGNKDPKVQIYKINFQVILTNYDGMQVVPAPVLAAA